MNEQTAVNNYYQKVLDNLTPSSVNAKAQEEFDTFVQNFSVEKAIANFKIRPDYDLHPPQIAPLERNKIIVDIASIMVFCYDGRMRGGTFQAHNYATKALLAGRLSEIIMLPSEAIS